jgi:hypothetical protein
VIFVLVLLYAVLAAGVISLMVTMAMLVRLCYRFMKEWRVRAR